MINKLIGGVAVLALVIAGIAASKPAQVIDRTNTVQVGAVSNPELLSSYFGFGGVRQWAYRTGLNQSSTTVCSIQSPAATSTLLFGSITLTTGTTTTLFWDIAKDTTYAATTTRLASASLTGGLVGTLVASTSVNAAGASFDQPSVFAPNTYLNFKYGGAQGATNVLVGNCNAIFVQNSGY